MPSLPKQYTCSYCGATYFARPSDVKRGAVKSCGCLRRNAAWTKNQKELTGQTIGFLEVIRDSGERKRGLVVWACYCHHQGPGCKGFCEVVSEQFRKGTISCGCYARNQTRKRALAIYKEE
jgi:hypothetical protein